MENSNEIWDFGFTAVTEEELKDISSTVYKATSDSEKLVKLYDAICPLLDNLLKDPDKEYLYWPTRAEQVNKFKEYLNGIYSA